jgi:hypothetical protein
VIIVSCGALALPKLALPEIYCCLGKQWRAEADNCELWGPVIIHTFFLNVLFRGAVEGRG